MSTRYQSERDKGKGQSKHTPLTIATLPTHPTTHPVWAQTAAGTAGSALLLLQRRTTQTCGTATMCQPLLPLSAEENVWPWAWNKRWVQVTLLLGKHGYFIYWFVLHTHGWIWPNPSLSVPWERGSITTPRAVAAEAGDGAGPPRQPALGSAPRSHPRALATPSGGTVDFAWQSETNDNRHVFLHHCSSST